MTPNPLHGAIDEREDLEGDAQASVTPPASGPRATGAEPSDPARQLPDRNSPIPREVLAAAHRKLCRRFAATLVRAMAETDMGAEQIAARLHIKGRAVRGWINTLMDGRSTKDSLNWIADMATAMDCEIEISIAPLPQAQGTEAEGRDAQRLGAKPESPAAEGDAPPPSSSSP